MAGGSGTRSRRLWLINGAIALVVVLAIVGTVVALTTGSKNSTEGLRTTALGRGTVIETVSASGTVTTSRNATVNFSTTGKIASVRVKLGDRVRKGQVVASLDGEFARQNLTAAQLKVDADEKNVGAAQKRVTADEQALDAAEAAADVPLNERSGSTGASGGSSGQTAMPNSSAPMSNSLGTNPSSPSQPGGNLTGANNNGQVAAAQQQAGQPQMSRAPAAPAPQQAAPPSPAAQQQAAPAPAPAPVPVEPPWWCFWCDVTYVYPPPQAAPPASSTPMPTSAMPSSSAAPTSSAAAGAGQGAQATQSQGPSGAQKKATREQDDANIKSAKATLAESRATLAANEATLAQDKANLISAQNATDDLDLVAPQDGQVSTVDGQVGQIVGPQGIVLSGTDTGNPTGGRLPDGTAVSSGANGNGTSSSGSSGGSSSGGGSGGGGGGGGGSGGSSSSSGSSSSGTNGTSVTASPVVPAVLTLIGTDQMQVRADVPELDIGRVANGEQVDVRINALPEAKVGGTVASVNLLPGSGDTVQYGTNVALPVPPAGLRPGMSANVTITTRSAPNVLFLPSSAIRGGGEGAKTGTVQVLSGPDNHQESRTIGLGLSSDTVTEITSGLREGEIVVLPEAPPSQPNRGGGGGGGGR